MRLQGRGRKRADEIKREMEEKGGIVINKNIDYCFLFPPLPSLSPPPSFSHGDLMSVPFVSFCFSSQLLHPPPPPSLPPTFYPLPLCLSLWLQDCWVVMEIKSALASSETMQAQSLSQLLNNIKSCVRVRRRHQSSASVVRVSERAVFTSDGVWYGGDDQPLRLPLHSRPGVLHLQHHLLRLQRGTSRWGEKKTRVWVRGQPARNIVADHHWVWSGIIRGFFEVLPAKKMNNPIHIQSFWIRRQWTCGFTHPFLFLQVFLQYVLTVINKHHFNTCSTCIPSQPSRHQKVTSTESRAPIGLEVLAKH